MLVGTLGLGLVIWGLLMLIQGPHHLPGTIVEVTQLVDVQWASGSHGLQHGDQLKPPHRLELLSGSIELAFHHGPRMVVEGPAKVRLDSAGAVRLQHGKLSVDVPQVAVGFTVRTHAVDVVDLGTRFGVHVVEGGDAQVHVFEGEVETHSAPGKTGVVGRQTLSQTQAAQFNRQGKLIRWIDPDYQGFALGGDPVEGVIGTGKGMRLLVDPPDSLAPGALESNDHVFVIPEKRGVKLPQTLTVTFDLRNRSSKGSSSRSRFGNHSAKLPAGMRVDSYLLHFDPSAANEGVLGHVAFRGRIVAVIAKGNQLAATDALFGRDGLQYPSGPSKYRGLDDGKDGDEVEPKHDVLLLGPGPHRIGGQFNVSHRDIDQMRILVLDEPE